MEWDPQFQISKMAGWVLFMILVDLERQRVETKCDRLFC